MTAVQDLTERLRTLAAEADAKQARVTRLEAQLLESLSKGGSNDQDAPVEVTVHFDCCMHHIVDVGRPSAHCCRSSSSVACAGMCVEAYPIVL